jgi:L-alanine-DL-glutamate epimerase-like enolase superfamily enzyme
MFLGSSVALGITAYAAKTGSFKIPPQIPGRKSVDGVGSDGVGHAKHAREDSPDVSPGFRFNDLKDSNMKITKIETIPLRLPVKPFADGVDKTGGKPAPSKFYQGEPFEGKRNRNEEGHLLMAYVFVKIHTDKGIIGMGEAPTDSVETLETVKFTIDRYMTPKLIGLNPFDIERNNDLVSFRKNGRVIAHHSSSAINYALYDILGKTLNVPLYTLLGGLYRTKVLASVEVPGGPPEEMAAHSMEYYKQGIRGIKAKVGSDPDRDAKALKAIREALGDKISLRADANQQYTIQEAIRLCRLAKEYDVGLELLEQPTASTDWEGVGRIISAVDIPIEADEAADSLYQVYQLLQNNACDIINTKCSKAGGISGVKKWAAVAESARKTIVIGTEYGLGNIVASKVHLGCAIKNADPIVEFTEIMLHDLLLKKPLELKDGYIEVPAEPGVGWEFDSKKIEKYTVHDFPK